MAGKFWSRCRHRCPACQRRRTPNWLALTASHTGPLECRDVASRSRVAARRPGRKRDDRPQRHEYRRAANLGAGDRACRRPPIDFLERESRKRPDLVRADRKPSRTSTRNWKHDLLVAGRRHEACSSDDVRARANSLALRAAQAALAAAKGTGYVAGHPAGRWCREALFFLVWSCPQPVMAANLCELAGLG